MGLVIQPSVVYRFGPFTVDRAAYRVLRGDAPLALTPKVVDLLLYLLDRPSALVTKDDLLKALWPDVIVTENALTQAISDLRQALGDSAAAPTYVQTVSRRGYRFVAPVERVQAEAAPRHAGDKTEATAPPRAAAGTIAVADFVNVSGDADFAWLATGIAETVTNDLRGLKDLRVVDRVRVVDAASRAASSPQALGAELGAGLLVVGGFQRSGHRLRITARIVDARDGHAMADAKVDGVLDDVFELQDRIVKQFSASLGLAMSAAAEARSGVRETSSLEAYQAFTEGRLRLEALDPTQLAAGIEDFERAVAFDLRYALAYVGLANAHFFRYEMSRALNRPDLGLLATAVGYARRAVELDEGLAEAHATLAFLLVSADRGAEALAAARRAVALEPSVWRHQFRLGHAAWGGERLAALSRALELYPEFAYGYFEMAMVHIARGAIGLAEPILRQGIARQDQRRGRRERFPSKGLRWLLGLTRLAKGDVDEALLAFERELGGEAAQLYAPEFAMDAFDGKGFALLRRDDPVGSATMFRKALGLYPGHARSHLGLAVALERQGVGAEAASSLAGAERAIAELERGPRQTEAAMARAFDHVVRGRPEDAVAVLDRLLRDAPPGFAGWTIPVEPLFDSLGDVAGFRKVLDRLARRAG